MGDAADFESDAAIRPERERPAAGAPFGRSPLVFDLGNFSLRDMAECSAALRTIGEGASCMEDVARRLVRYVYDQMGRVHAQERGCTLVRFFKTHPFGELDPALQSFALRAAGNVPLDPAVKCLVLLATVGDRPEWNARESSVGHQAIPLSSEQLVRRFPMISQLVGQLGMPIGAVVELNHRVLLDLERKTFNVFYVPQAKGSPYVPAQAEFVEPAGIQSVLGFGGMLPTGDMFALLLFSKVAIPRSTAELFQPLALSVKLAILPFAEGPVFAG
jgi:hypothetical protein